VGAESRIAATLIKPVAVKQFREREQKKQEQERPAGNGQGKGCDSRAVGESAIDAMQLKTQKCKMVRVGTITEIRIVRGLLEMIERLIG